jgi:hypothetical protein
MRDLILLGAIGAALAASESVAYALPPNSPYAILVPESVDRGVIDGRYSYESRSGDDLSALQYRTPENFRYYSRGP